MFILGGGLYTTVLRYIVDRDLFTSILATFGNRPAGVAVEVKWK